MTIGLLDRKAAARFLTIGLRTLDRLASEGEIPSTKIGGSVRFHVSDLEAYVEARRAEGKLRAQGARR